MTRYILRRVIQMIPRLLIIYSLIFVMTYLLPGDPVRAIYGEEVNRMSPTQIEQIKESLGVNRPFLEQYVSFIVQTLRLEFPESRVMRGQDVGDVIGYRLPRTLQLMLGGLLVALCIGIPAGIIAAIRQYTWLDHTLMLIALIGVSMPVFWQALIAQLFLTQSKYGVALFPPGGYGDGNLHYLMLPALVLGTHLAASIARITRSTMLEVKTQDFLQTARAKGLAPARILLRHHLSNALIPVITILGLQISGLLTGSVLTESVFRWPGLGQATVDAINARDVPIIMGLMVYGTIIILVINLITDVLYAIVDPRIRYS
ncbi:MAG: ABC transporter permease [Anaerolineae bacterium]|nr:ABC transporter permease [Anaerolineae bacterium]